MLREPEAADRRPDLLYRCGQRDHGDTQLRPPQQTYSLGYSRKLDGE